VDPELLASLLRNDDLQQLLQEDESFRDLICDVGLMNKKTGGTYFQDDPADKLKGLRVLDATVETVDCSFLHLC
jgi:hypothetical protein